MPILPSYDPQLVKILAESARLWRKSAELQKRIAELDQQAAERLPGMLSAKPAPRRKR